MRPQRPPHKDMTGSGRALSPMWAHGQVSCRASWMNEAEEPEGEDTLRVTGPGPAEEVWSLRTGIGQGEAKGRGYVLACMPQGIPSLTGSGWGKGSGCRAHAEDSGSLQQWPV